MNGCDGAIRAGMLVAVVCSLIGTGCETSGGGSSGDGAAAAAEGRLEVDDAYGYRSRLAFPGALTGDRPAESRRRLARKNLGLALALRRRLPDFKRRRKETRESERARADAAELANRTVELAAPYRELDLGPVREAYRRVAERGAPLVLTGTYHPVVGPERPTFNTIAMVAEDRLFPIFSNLDRPIRGFLVEPDRQRVAALVKGRDTYAWAVYWIELDTFRVRRTGFETRGELDWVRVGWGRHSGELRFRGERKHRVVVGRCSVRGDRDCEWSESRDLQQAVGPARRSPETWMSVHHVPWVSTALPSGFMERFDFVDPDPAGRLVVPSVRLSPDERRVAYVTVDGPYADEPIEKRLWVEHLGSGRRRIVAEGESWFGARWLDGRRLVFDAPQVVTGTEEGEPAPCTTGGSTRAGESLQARRCRLRSRWRRHAYYVRQYDVETRETSVWVPSPWAHLRTPADEPHDEIEFRDWPGFVFR